LAHYIYFANSDAKAGGYLSESPRDRNTAQLSFFYNCKIVKNAFAQLSITHLGKERDTGEYGKICGI